MNRAKGRGFFVHVWRETNTRRKEVFVEGPKWRGGGGGGGGGGEGGDINP